jgi:hypothetical protein
LCREADLAGGDELCQYLVGAHFSGGEKDPFTIEDVEDEDFFVASAVSS